MLRQSLQRRCHSFARSFSSLPTNIPVPPTTEEPTYNLNEVARRKRRTEWKRRQGVRRVQPNPPTSPLDFFTLLHRDKHFSTISLFTYAQEKAVTVASHSTANSTNPSVHPLAETADAEATYISSPHHTLQLSLQYLHGYAESAGLTVKEHGKVVEMVPPSWSKFLSEPSYAS
jgi:hypothetical protein